MIFAPGLGASGGICDFTIEVVLLAAMIGFISWRVAVEGFFSGIELGGGVSFTVTPLEGIIVGVVLEGGTSRTLPLSAAEGFDAFCSAPSKVADNLQTSRHEYDYKL
jgi:hypothetical protein